MKNATVLIAVLVFTGVGLAQATNPAMRPTTAGASFDKLKTLVGEWEGNLNEGGKQIPATTSFRLGRLGADERARRRHAARDGHHVSHGQQRFAGHSLLRRASAVCPPPNRMS